MTGPLPADAEEVLAAPPDVPSWTENLLFALYDGTSDVGMWLHLGTSPADWNLWEDRALLTLPDGAGVLTQWAYHRTDPARRPAGANLGFRMIDPFRKWNVTFDGFALLTTHDDLRRGLVTDGPKQRVVIDLDVELVTPPWDARTAAAHASGKGSMESQDWASDHYEQLCAATGTVTLPSGQIAFEGTGWRDHSRGPRGTGVGSTWGGHVIMGAWFPRQQRGIGLSRYWTPTGEVSLEGGYLVEGGELRHVAVGEIPLLTDLQASGERLRFGVDDDGTPVALEATTRSAIWTMMSSGMPYGVDLSPSGIVYAINFADCALDGEAGHLYVERSGTITRPSTLEER